MKFLPSAIIIYDERLVTSRRRKRKQKGLSIKKNRIHKKVANLKHYKALKAKKSREEA